MLSAAPFAAIGPATSVLEAAATAVGAGMLLGGFVVGVASLISRRGYKSARAIGGAGYVGGVAALALLLVDLIIG